MGRTPHTGAVPIRSSWCCARQSPGKDVHDEVRMKSAAALGALILAAALQPLGAAPIPARFPEGVTHGYLVLSGVDGVTLAHGDLLQFVRGGGEVDKRMIFHFKDGSVFDENVTFTQREVYALKSYRLAERGPVFDGDREISLT